MFLQLRTADMTREYSPSAEQINRPFISFEEIERKPNLMQPESNSPTSDQFTGLDKFAEVLPAPHPMARRSFLRSLGLGAALLTPAAALV